MHILFTGGSSFTGMWFVKALAEAGHKVTATLLHPESSYEDIRKNRVLLLKEFAKVIENCPFGSPEFIQLIKNTKPDLLCHHAADVTDYKSPHFDYLKATQNNTHNIEKIIDELQQVGCNKIIITGTVFEQGEGIGSDDLRAFSPYGLSKGLSFEIFKYFCSIKNCLLGKFVIPNPFGPYEEERFTTYLIKTWAAGKSATLSFPLYIRDNIHVSLLAKAYQKFSENLSPQYLQTNPSGYAESQQKFTERFANEIKARTSLPCLLEIKEQNDFPEPLIRINSQPINIEESEWNEKNAWDELVTYYRKTHNIK